MFWSREVSTVKGYVSKVKEIIKRWQDRNDFIPLSDFTAWKLEDKMGMDVAITMFEKSLEKGRLSSYTQFDSCRPLRGAASSVYMASAQANEGRGTSKSLSGKVFHSQDDPMQSTHMERFAKRMKARMPV